MRRFYFFIIILIGLLAIATGVRGGSKPVYSITLADEIVSPVTAEYISGAIDKAEADGAECLIIRLDTPGGLLTSTRQIVKKMMGSGVPIVVYVAPAGARAGSAGVFITLAANVAVMAPSTNIGAAHPVSLQQRRSLTDVLEDLAERLKKDEKRKKGKKKETEPREPMEDKVLNDTVAWVKAVATTRGRNVGWAIKAVTESVSISDDEALKKGVIDLIAPNVDELLASIDGREVTLPEGKVSLSTRGAQVTEIPMTMRRKVLAVLASPNIAYILLMLGLYGLLFEFTHPGIGFPGVAGTIAVIVAFYGLHLIAANYAGVALIILAIILFIMEVKIVSYGLLTLGGIISMVLGSLMLFNSPYQFMRVSLPLILAFTVATLAIVGFLVTIVVRSHKRRIATGAEGLIGTKGEVRGWEGRRGKIFVHGEIWDAEGDRDYMRGDSVEVIEVKGMKLVVK